MRSTARVTLPLPIAPRAVVEPLGTAFVLSGGGNHGAAQVGMLQALLEAGITPDVIVGTSVGALNGAALAADPTLEGVLRLEKLWRRTRAEHIFPGGRIKRAWALVGGGTHLCPNRGLVGLIDGVVPNMDFGDLVVPLRVIATDLNSGEEVVFAAGSLKPALLASAALPGTFPPVPHDSRLLIDGGVVDNVPLSHAFAGPVARVFVLNVTAAAGADALRNPLDVVLRAFAIARNQRFDREVAAAPPGVEVVLLPRPEDSRSPFDFSHPEDLIIQAHALASAHLESLAATAAAAAMNSAASSSSSPATALRKPRRRFARLVSVGLLAHEPRPAGG